MSTRSDATHPTFPKPPTAHQEPSFGDWHGERLRDDYAWLRDRDDPRVIEYLEAENAYTEAVTASSQDLQQVLYDEVIARLEEDDASVPVKDGPYFYFHRTEKDRQYPIFCRRRGEDGDEEVILDLNALATDKSYLRLGSLEVSPDHRLLAYSVDENGSERFTLKILDLDTGEHLEDTIENTGRSVEWRNDSRSFYYSTLDDARRPSTAFHHRLGQPSAEDEQVYHEDDERFFLGIGKTRSGRFLVIHLGSHTTSEVRYLDLDDDGAEFRLLAPRQQGVEVSIDHHGDHLYILTNEDALNFRLLRARIDQPDAWEEVIPHRDDVMLDGIDLFRSYLVTYLRRDGLRNIAIMDFATGTWHEIEHHEAVYAVWPQENREFETDTLRFLYTSLVTPRTVYDYRMDSRERTLRKRYAVLGGYDPEVYHSEGRMARSADGTEVPVSIVYRGSDGVDSPRPTLLYGYGSYGNSIDPYFSSPRLSLLDRGFVYAIAHIRGGGEMGRSWYENGKLEHKQNTFDDFIAAAEMLIDEGFTTPQQLSIRGGSAGGLLVGAVLNQRPELFNAAVAEVPFVDVLNTMLDPSLPLTVIEYEEWGNPEHKEAFDRIRAYSPYDNIEAKAYPHLLVTAGINDPRVQYWEPAKWVARLRATRTGDSLLLLKTNMDSGHGGASGRYDAIREEAFKLAFLIEVSKG